MLRELNIMNFQFGSAQYSMIHLQREIIEHVSYSWSSLWLEVVIITVVAAYVTTGDFGFLSLHRMTKRPHFVQAQLHLVWNSPKFLLMVRMCNHCSVLTALKFGRILCIQIGTFTPPVHSVKSTKSENTHQTEHWRGHSYGSFILKSAFAWLCFVIHTFGSQARITPPIPEVHSKCQII